MSLNFITKLLVLSLLPLLFTAVSCNKPTEPPPPENYALEIIAVDASCTEVWIDVKTPNTLLPQIFTLIENGEEKGSVTIDKADTTIIIENLLPKKSYKYQLKNNEHKSNQTEITTLDTTSHNFTWQTFEFGQNSSSVLYDVAIIDENNIWAVGEIYMNDALGNPDPQAYNAVHWDGNEWELKRIYTYSSCSSVDYAPLKSVIAFSDSNVIVTSGGGIWTIRGNNVIPNCGINPILTGAVNKLWGSSSNDLYAVGNNGNIAHWNGSSWKKIESPIGTSGTTLDIYDIWGDYNNKTKEWEILAVASHYGISSEKEILQINNNTVKKLSTNTNPPMEPLVTTWFVPNRKYYVAGSGIYQKNSLMDSLWKHNLYSITTYATTSIRGNGINDVIGVGAFGDVVHFNGKNWKSDYQEPLLSNGSYTEVAIKGNLVVAVGGNNSKAVALFGRRY